MVLTLRQRNIWNIFYLVLVLWASLVFYLATESYRSYYNEVLNEQKSLVKLSVSSIESMFEQYEMVLGVLARKFGNNDVSSNLDETFQILDSVIVLDDTLVDVALIKLDGKLYASSILGLNHPESMNLLDMSYTSESFIEASQSQSVVIGRTYFNDYLNTWIVPIRKAVRNTEGKVIFVLSAAVKLESAFKAILEHEKDWNLYDSYIFREDDRYFQLAPISDRSREEIYGVQISQNDVDNSIMALEEFTGLSFEQLKQSREVVVNELEHAKRKSITTSMFIEKFGLWFTTEIRKSTITSVVVSEVTQMVFILLIALIVIFVLFRSLDKHQKGKFKALSLQANQDYLTHLKNRYYLENNFSSVASDSGALVFLDLDNFKVINDTFGHEVGDKVLIAIAQRFKALTEESEYVIRFSGDEFIFCLPGYSGKTLEHYCLNLLKEVSLPICLTEYTFSITASAGVASYPENGKSLDSLKRMADFALYEAKGTRNSVVFYNKTIDSKYLYIGKIEQELKHALVNDELYLVYQPQCNKDGKIVGIETLIRWDNPQLGEVRPDQFISVAEASGDIIPIGRFVVNQAMHEISNIAALMSFQVTLSINISVMQLLNTSFKDDLLTAYNASLQKSTVKVVLEVTESLFMDNELIVIDLLKDLKSSGFLISLDDFGTGYSSLSLLEKLPLDELKLDKSFVDSIAQSDSGLKMVEGIIDLAHSLNLSVVAEGVETEEQRVLLASFGCDLYQGYLFSKPLRKEPLLEYLKHHNG